MRRRNGNLSGLCAALAAFLPSLALAQPVQQGGVVTPGHAASWTTTGVLQDAGTSTTPKLTTLGIQASGLSSFCINNGPATGAYSALCLGLNHSVANLSVTGFNGETAPPLVLPSLGGPLNLVGWTTAGRPSPPKNYAIGFNTDTSTLDLWNGSAWQNGSAFTGGAVPNPTTFASPVTFGATGNVLTITPATLAGQPINLTQSGTGGIASPAELFLTGAGTGLSVSHNALVGGTFQVTGVSTFTGGVGGTMAANIVEVNSINTYGNLITLSGSTVPTYMGKYVANWAGTSTVAGNTSLAAFNIGTASDNAAVASGTRNELLITGNYGGVAFDGFRQGVMVQMNFNTASTLSSASGGAGGLESKVVPSANFGGSAGNYKGAFFGANPWADCKNGATFLSQCVGTEIDAALATGASASNFTVQQNVITNDHAVHGINADVGIALVAQTNLSPVGVKNARVIGSYQAQWPVDPNGYLDQALTSFNYTLAPDTAAGGSDWLQVAFSGAGINGGGFAWRSVGASTSISATAIDGSGAIKLGSSYLSATATTTTTLDASLYSFQGISSVVSGGTGYTGNGSAGSDIVDDGYGNEFYVTASAGVVSALTLKLRAEGKTAAPSVSSLAFNLLVASVSTSRGSGLTVTENAWTQAGTTLNFGTATATALNLGNSGSTTTFAGVVTMPTSTTGAGTQTFVNSPCSGLTTEKWIPVHITGQTGTWNIPACQ